MTSNDIRVAVIGLGYVGLPLALAFAKTFKKTVGYDINHGRISDLCRGHDRFGETPASDFKGASISFTSKPEEMAGCNFFVIGVPTPVDENNQPDLSPLLKACGAVGSVLKKGGVVVVESTVYPGVTEQICAPVISKVSGLEIGKDFKLGYTPERINPGDSVHSLQNVIKVISAQDEETLDLIAHVYGTVVKAGLHRAPSIKVAEAAKVIENTQRDLNIALMNELAVIFDRLDIRTRDVLEAAGTKWNFLKFYPGLVGGHCIGVDPYYLTALAQQLGYHPEVILAGRRINDGMGRYIAQRTVKLMVNTGNTTRNARVGVLGISFKENVADTRNSRVPDIVHELREFGCRPLIHDPIASKDMVKEEYGIDLVEWEEMTDLDAMIVAVVHDVFVDKSPEKMLAPLRKGGVLVDVKSCLKSNQIRQDLVYWSL